ncbi:putative pyridoxal 5'-phosphate synthase subunit PDX1 [Sesamum angolense]|uniref:pyridoxal 5'-phosphate synthase (glutamine hydrolyzing) n=1 Tax=Sesamum angolense TaxID=2727404 RepID=A0AAE1WTB9_9LAMI|nr:putative pyridoxal 5'-phosphate synthase subunit PDX1 [Sesamum angolense]
MAGSGVVTVYGNGAITETTKQSPFSVKVGLAQMLRGGVIMDVVTPEQARVAEEAGACAVMALERVPADIRAQGGVARMSDPQLIKEIKQAVTIPVMAKARIGHFVEAQILEAIGIDYVDESEVLTLADDENHINKHNFRIPFVCGCRNLGEALRRIREGAAMIRTKGEAGTGNIIEAVRHVRSVMGDIRVLRNMDDDEVFTFAKKLQAPYDLVMQTKQLGRLPVVHFAAGGVATPADAALMMQLGCDGVFVGSGVFKSGDPARRARAIVQAVTHYSDPEVLAEVSCGLGEAMVGINLNDDKVEREGFWYYKDYVLACQICSSLGVYIVHMHVSLVSESGNTTDDFKLPTDENLLNRIKNGFEEGKDLVVCAMGEEQICALKDIGPKN